MAPSPPDSELHSRAGFSWEGKLVRELLLPLEAEPKVRAWVEQAAPPVLASLRPLDASSPDGCQSAVTGTLWRSGSRLELRFDDHEAGLIHRVAALAAEAGHRALVFEGENPGHRGGSAVFPFYAATEYGPDVVPQPVLYDPARGLADSLGVVRALLAKFTKHQPEREFSGNLETLGDEGLDVAQLEWFVLRPPAVVECRDLRPVTRPPTPKPAWQVVERAHPSDDPSWVPRAAPPSTPATSTFVLRGSALAASAVVSSAVWWVRDDSSGTGLLIAIAASLGLTGWVPFLKLEADHEQQVPLPLRLTASVLAAVTPPLVLWWASP